MFHSKKKKKKEIKFFKCILTLRVTVYSATNYHFNGPRVL